MSRVAVTSVWSSGFMLTALDCATCGVVFALTTEYYGSRRRDGHGFHCPNGHSNVFSSGESAAARELREMKERAERAEQDAATQRRARTFAESAAKGAAISAGHAKAKLRRAIVRVHAGVVSTVIARSNNWRRT